MMYLSPDGLWRWNGTSWEPNSSAAAAPLRAGTNPAQRDPAPSKSVDGVAWTSGEISAAAWSHFGPVLVTAFGLLFLVMSIGWNLSWMCIVTLGIPLLIRLTRGRVSSFVSAHAHESLNFQLTWFLGAAVAVMIAVASGGQVAPFTVPCALTALGFVLIFMTRAGMAAKRAERYRYPFTIRFF